MQAWRQWMPFFPLSVAAFYGGVVALSTLGVLPSGAEIVALLQSWYELYGLGGLFASSVLETIAYIGLYFPGSVVIVVTVLLSGGGPGELLAIASVVAAATVVGCLISYALGRSRYVLVDAPPPTSRRSRWLTFVLAHLHPNAIALWYARAGWRRHSIGRFLPATFIIMGVWSWTFWMLVQLMLVEPATQFDERFVIAGALTLWVLLETAIKYRRYAQR